MGPTGGAPSARAGITGAAECRRAGPLAAGRLNHRSPRLPDGYPAPLPAFRPFAAKSTLNAAPNPTHPDRPARGRRLHGPEGDPSQARRRGAAGARLAGGDADRDPRRPSPAAGPVRSRGGAGPGAGGGPGGRAAAGGAGARRGARRGGCPARPPGPGATWSRGWPRPGPSWTGSGSSSTTTARPSSRSVRCWRSPRRPWGARTRSSPRSLGTATDVDQAREQLARARLAVTLREQAIAEHPARLAALEAKLAEAERDAARGEIGAPFAARIGMVEAGGGGSAPAQSDHPHPLPARWALSARQGPRQPRRGAARRPGRAVSA